MSPARSRFAVVAAVLLAAVAAVVLAVLAVGRVPVRPDDVGTALPTGSRAPATRVAAVPSSPPTEYTVCVQPLGEHDGALMEPIGRGIAQAYGFRVRTLAPRPLPAAAWYPARSRHRADALLEHLLFDVLPGAEGCHAVLGLTGVDISATRGEHFDWGVLGLAFFGQRVAVVSSFRLRAGVDQRGVAVRAVKVAIHELGHVAGVPHRDDGPACVMNDALGAVATIDRAQGALCAPERADAERYLGRPLPVRDTLDWRKILDGD